MVVPVWELEPSVMLLLPVRDILLLRYAGITDTGSTMALPLLLLSPVTSVGEMSVFDVENACSCCTIILSTDPGDIGISSVGVVTILAGDGDLSYGPAGWE